MWFIVSKLCKGITICHWLLLVAPSSHGFSGFREFEVSAIFLGLTPSGILSLLHISFFFAATSLCGLIECDFWRDWIPEDIQPQQLLHSIKLWAFHTSVDPTLYNKSHFFWADCCVFNLSLYANKIIKLCKDNDGGSRRDYHHMQTRKTGKNIHRNSFSCNFDHPVGWFVYEGRRFLQYQLTIVWENGHILMFFPSGKGHPEDGDGDPIPFPFKSGKYIL